MNLFSALVLGVVEGITEFLPVSSTGHLILAAHLLGFSQGEFMKSFEIVIQLGAILAVVVLYWKLLLRDFEVMKRVFVAFLPTATVGFLLYKIIKKYLLAGHGLVVWTLLLGGILIILFERWHKESENSADDIKAISYKHLVFIGLFQCIAMVPGVSRSACTIIGGLLLGIKRKTIAEFSFLLAVPTMLAATALDLVKNASGFSGDQFHFLAAGFIASFVVALLAIKFLIAYIKNHNFTAFGIYRVAAALLFWIFVR